MNSLMNQHPNFYQWKHLEENHEPVTSWSPRVDVEAAVPFMPREPIDVMSAGDFHPVSWMAGMTDDEGAARAHSFFADMRGIREFEREEAAAVVDALTDSAYSHPIDTSVKIHFLK